MKIAFFIIIGILIAIPLYLIIRLTDREQEDKDQEKWIKEWNRRKNDETD